MIITISNDAMERLIPELKPINMLDSTAVGQFNNDLLEYAKTVPRHDHEYGHLRAIATPNQYVAYSPGQPWVESTHPGMAPNYAQFGAFPLDAQKAATKNIYNWSIATWANNDNFNKCVHHVINKAIPNAYKFADNPSRKATFGHNITNREILHCLMRSYGKLTPQEIEENEKQLRAPFNQEKPIKVLIQHFKTVKLMASYMGANKIVDKCLTTSFVAHLQSCPKYNNATKEWNTVPKSKKAWTRCQQHFKEGHCIMVEQAQQTTGAQGYGNAFSALAKDDSINGNSISSLQESIAQINLCQAESIQTFSDFSQSHHEQQSHNINLANENATLKQQITMLQQQQQQHTAFQAATPFLTPQTFYTQPPPQHYNPPPQQMPIMH